MNDQGKLRGRKALVTGSGTGIGREIALEFGRQGADVVLHYGHSAAGAQSAAEAIQAMGRRSVAVKANFESAEQALNLAHRAIEFLGSIDCLVNNSGITIGFSTRNPKLDSGSQDPCRFSGINPVSMGAMAITPRLREPLSYPEVWLAQCLCEPDESLPYRKLVESAEAEEQRIRIRSSQSASIDGENLNTLGRRQLFRQS